MYVTDWPGNVGWLVGRVLCRKVSIWVAVLLNTTSTPVHKKVSSNSRGEGNGAFE